MPPKLLLPPMVGGCICHVHARAAQGFRARAARCRPCLLCAASREGIRSGVMACLLLLLLRLDLKKVLLLLHLLLLLVVIHRPAPSPADRTAAREREAACEQALRTRPSKEFSSLTC